MSNVYVSEPATSGKVIFETTHGPLEIQLWCRECPTTTRFFLQLCLDGFYDGMLFHRIVPSFLIQTGAVRQNDTSTGDAALMMKEYRQAVRADLALERRQLELHSRLRFNHRGQVSMALPVDDDEDAVDLQPQFFITLEESRNLDGKYVLFGTITGPTYFNAARIGSLDVDPQTNMPDMEHAPRVVSVKIVDNPIHQDLVPQQRVPWRVAKAEQPKKKKRKGKFDRNVLSFGDEVEEIDIPLTETKKSLNLDEEEVRGDDNLHEKDDGAHLLVDAQLSDKANRHAEQARETERTVQDEDARSATYQEEVDESSGLQYSSSKHRQASPPKQDHVAKTNTSMEQKQETQSILEIRNAKYRKAKTSKKDREGDTLAKLFSFKSKVKAQVTGKSSTDHEDNSLAARMARRAQAEATSNGNGGTTYHGQVLESDDEEHEEKNKDWLKTTFKCRRHIDHTAGGDGRNMNDYEVVDSHGERTDREHETLKDHKHRSGDKHSHDRRDIHPHKKHKSNNH